MIFREEFSLAQVLSAEHLKNKLRLRQHKRFQCFSKKGQEKIKIKQNSYQLSFLKGSQCANTSYKIQKIRKSPQRLQDISKYVVIAEHKLKIKEACFSLNLVHLTFKKSF